MQDKLLAPSPRIIKELFWSVPVGILFYIILDIIAQNLPPYYSPISVAESDLAVGPFGYIMTINFIVRGFWSSCFIYGLWSVLNAKERIACRHGFWLLGIWTIGSFLLAAFPTD